MRIARVFPTRTSHSPTDPDAYFGPPDLFTPKYDEVHISVTFTWDKLKAERLAYEWRNFGNVRVGGPAVNSSGDGTPTIFQGGCYLKRGITITSRGCPNNCTFCFVPIREGKIRTLPIIEGNILQDNNLTACPREHLDGVFKMLSKQKQISFRGGLESARITDEFVERLRSIRIYDLWLAYDHENADKPLERAVQKLSKYFRRDQIRCYVLIGYGDDTEKKAEIRLRKAWDIGTLPFAMLYRDNNGRYKYEMKKFQRLWSRPAIIKSMCKEKEDK